MSTGESMLSGAIAGCAVVMATHPIWTVNVSYSFYLWEEDTIKRGRSSNISHDVFLLDSFDSKEGC
jgi:adenine nucleotide transporter 17